MKEAFSMLKRENGMLFRRLDVYCAHTMQIIAYYDASSVSNAAHSCRLGIVIMLWDAQDRGAIIHGRSHI